MTPEEAAAQGVKLVYLNTNACEDAVASLRALTDGKGFDDVFVYAPVRSVVEMADSLLARDGCLNFFAGPTDTAFSAMFNFYNVHYSGTHIVGTSGGNSADMLESIAMMEKGGLDSVCETTLNLPHIKGGKKLVYTNISMPMTAIADFAALGETDPVFAKLAEIVAGNNGLWCAAAERYLLANAKPI